VLYLQDIVQAAGAVGRFIAGVRRNDFMEDELRQSGVLQELIVLFSRAIDFGPVWRYNTCKDLSATCLLESSMSQQRVCVQDKLESRM
jgi:hypothetical protein